MKQFLFDKMHGAGNDFVVTHDPACPLDKNSVAMICDRKFGVGSDGLIMLSREADGIRFQFWNPDGAKAEMCGNGLRCAMEYSCNHGLTDSNEAVFLTDSGVLSAVRLYPGSIRIRMPQATEPVLKEVKVAVINHADNVRLNGFAKGNQLTNLINREGRTCRIPL